MYEGKWPWRLNFYDCMGPNGRGRSIRVNVCGLTVLEASFYRKYDARWPGRLNFGEDMTPNYPLRFIFDEVMRRNGQRTDPKPGGRPESRRRTDPKPTGRPESPAPTLYPKSQTSDTIETADGP